MLGAFARRPAVFAHRGLHDRAPENTMPAFEHAAAIGVDGIETDVRLDRDGVPILFHDARLGCGTSVASLSRDEVSARAGIAVPTLDEAMAAPLDLWWNIEIKTAAAVGPAIAVLRRHLGRRRIVVSSFIHAAAAEVARGLGVPGALLVAHCPDGPLLDPGRLPEGIAAVVWHAGTMDRAALDWARDVGLVSAAYGFGCAADHLPCVEAGADVLITDFPAALLSADQPVPLSHAPRGGVSPCSPA